MSSVPSSPQDFARLLQDKLIEAGESRPLEFRADLFGFVPRGAGIEQLFPLDNYYRYYLGAKSDGERQQVVKHFVRDWQGHFKTSGSLAGATFAGQPAVGGAYPIQATLGYRLQQRPRSNAGRMLIVVLGMVGLLFGLMCIAPCVLGIMAQNAAQRAARNAARQRMANFPAQQNFPGMGMPEWQFQAPADSEVTGLLGGQGGAPRFYSDPTGKPVVGLAWSLDQWGGETALGSLQPMFERGAEPELDLRHEPTVEWAREGYVLGGLAVEANNYVNAVQAKWVKLEGGQLDWTDTYQGEWLGESMGRPPRVLGDEGSEVIGIALRQGLVVDSVGLILKRRAGAVGQAP